MSSLPGVWDLIGDTPFDILALQEMRISNVAHWQQEAARAGMQLVVPTLECGEHLVGFLVRTGTLCTVQLPLALGSNRAHTVAWHFDQGPPILVCNMYGYVTPTAAQQDELGRSISTFLDHSEGQGAPLAILVGDFNQTRQQVPQAHWLDFCQWADMSDEPTCLAGKAPRRIDWLVSSRALQHRIAGKQLQWDSGLSTHAWQALDLTRGTPASSAVGAACRLP